MTLESEGPIEIRIRWLEVKLRTLEVRLWITTAILVISAIVLTVWFALSYVQHTYANVTIPTAAWTPEGNIRIFLYDSGSNPYVITHLAMNDENDIISAPVPNAPIRSESGVILLDPKQLKWVHSNGERRPPPAPGTEVTALYFRASKSERQSSHTSN